MGSALGKYSPRFSFSLSQTQRISRACEAARRTACGLHGGLSERSERGRVSGSAAGPAGRRGFGWR